MTFVLAFDRAFVVQNSNGSASIAGRVPLACMTRRPATAADVMGGRARREGSELVAYVPRAFESVDAAVRALEAAGAPFEAPAPGTGK